MDYAKLSREVSYALRHAPWEYELELDEQGWVETILHEGLKPMKRQYVHFSVDTDTAKLVGGRKDSSPVILTIDAGRAAQEGIMFYHGNHNIWLADYIPPEFITDL